MSYQAEEIDYCVALGSSSSERKQAEIVLATLLIA